MNNLNKLLLIFTAVLLAGCFGENAVETAKTNNPNFEIDKLFTKDGCDIYRFRDAGYNRYFVNCANNQASISWNESCGKGCTNNVSVQTNTSDK
jgi:hypothetical protein